jgi:hypothetical protein
MEKKKSEKKSLGKAMMEFADTVCWKFFFSCNTAKFENPTTKNLSH